MSKTFIVYVSIDVADSRKHCELIENTVFPSKPNEHLTALQIKEKLVTQMGVDSKFIEVEPITDFMDTVNNDEFQTDEYFISYVRA